MKQAILITAYKNIPQLIDLLNSFGDNFLFFIHLDRKSKVNESEIESLKNQRGVRFLSRKYKVSWGGESHLYAILEILQEALIADEFSHFHLITAQDYPIKADEEMTSFLQSNADKIFMEYNPFPYRKWFEGGFERIDRYNLNNCIYGRDGLGRHVIMGAKAIQKLIRIKRSYPKTFPKQIYGGSTYWTLSRESVEYVFNYINEHPEYLRRFRWTFCAEEMFFQTIIMNSPLAKNVVNDSSRFIVWEERNGSYPANLDETDFENIKASTALFARKIQSPYSDTLLTKLKEYRAAD